MEENNDILVETPAEDTPAETTIEAPAEETPAE